MKASHGRGRGGWRALGLAAWVAASGGGGPAWAGPISSGATATPGPASGPTPGPLDPSGLAPRIPPLTLTDAATGSVTLAPTQAPGLLPPSPLDNPPAADGVVPTVAAPAVANFAAPSPTAAAPACCCTCPVNGMNPPPIVSNPPSPFEPPVATPQVPEPTSIVSALAMVGAAVVWRRRSRRVG